MHIVEFVWIFRKLCEKLPHNKILLKIHAYNKQKRNTFLPETHISILTLNKKLTNVNLGKYGIKILEDKNDA